MSVIEEKNLADLLKERTRDVHREAEKSQFLRALMRKELTTASYVSYLRRLHAVYVALEGALNSCCKASPELASIWRPEELCRVHHIEEDVAVLSGGANILKGQQPPTPCPDSPAARRYVERIEYVAENEPCLLVAHAYVRYLGDLNGGQIIKRAVRAALDLPAESKSGTSFYEFPKVKNMRAFKAEFRKSLQALKVGAHLQNAILDEAVVVFRLNIGLLLEMDALCGLNAAEAPTPAPAASTHNSSNSCPFATFSRRTRVKTTTSTSSTSSTTGLSTNFQDVLFMPKLKASLACCAAVALAAFLAQ